MLSTIKNLLGFGPSVDYKQLVSEGAVIIDVRSPGEFSGGNIPGSKNIPLDQLPSKMNQLKDKNQVIITCCASGMRSAAAKSALKSKGYTTVHNGGGWMRLLNKLG